MNTPVSRLVKCLISRRVDSLQRECDLSCELRRLQKTHHVARVTVVADTVGARAGPFSHGELRLVDAVHADHGCEEVALSSVRSSAMD